MTIKEIEQKRVASFKRCDIALHILYVIIMFAFFMSNDLKGLFCTGLISLSYSAIALSEAYNR